MKQNVLNVKVTCKNGVKNKLCQIPTFSSKFHTSGVPGLDKTVDGKSATMSSNRVSFSGGLLSIFIGSCDDWKVKLIITAEPVIFKLFVNRAFLKTQHHFSTALADLSLINTCAPPPLSVDFLSVI